MSTKPIYRDKTVTVIGMGKLGSPLAVLLASAGYSVWAADTNEAVIEKINRGEAPVKETGLQELLDRCHERVVGTTDIAKAAMNSNYVFIVVPTPSKPDGSYSTEYVTQSLAPIAEVIKAGRHLVVALVSTVSPGATTGTVVTTLEKLSGRRCGENFYVCYNPEFIALGNVLADMRNPSFLLIGSHDHLSGELLRAFYGDFYRALGLPVPPVSQMSLINAEITKLAVNCYCTTKIAYALALAELCEGIPGADARIVCKTLGMDRRIGPLYLRPGTAAGGPCFPRDNRAMMALGNMPLAEATDTINDWQTNKLAKLLGTKRPASVAILGLTYKTDTAITEESTGTNLAKWFSHYKQLELFTHDPAAAPSENWREKVKEADIVFITVAWDEYRSLTPGDFKPTARIVDCWGILNEEQFAGRDLVITGRGS